MRAVIPMAGRGQRFRDGGWDVPKPLIEAEGRPMVAWAAESLRGLPLSAVVFVVLEEHERRYGLTRMLRERVHPLAEVCVIPEVTEGQLCTVLAARRWIRPDEDLLIASSDTLVRSPLASDVALRPPECRGIISVADLPGDRWSFARTDASGRVVEVAEKRRISEHASTGLYYFASGREFLECGDELVTRGQRAGGEYYVIPVYGLYLERGWQVTLSRATEVVDMGTPQGLEGSRRTLKGLGPG